LLPFADHGIKDKEGRPIFECPGCGAKRVMGKRAPRKEERDGRRVGRLVGTVVVNCLMGVAVVLVLFIVV
jgi:hypothetical protein